MGDSVELGKEEDGNYEDDDDGLNPDAADEEFQRMDQAGAEAESEGPGSEEEEFRLELKAWREGLARHTREDLFALWRATGLRVGALDAKAIRLDLDPPHNLFPLEERFPNVQTFLDRELSELKDMVARVMTNWSYSSVSELVLGLDPQASLVWNLAETREPTAALRSTLARGDEKEISSLCVRLTDVFRELFSNNPPVLFGETMQLIQDVADSLIFESRFEQAFLRVEACAHIARTLHKIDRTPESIASQLAREATGSNSAALASSDLLDFGLIAGVHLLKMIADHPYGNPEGADAKAAGYSLSLLAAIASSGLLPECSLLLDQGGEESLLASASSECDAGDDARARLIETCMRDRAVEYAARATRRVSGDPVAHAVLAKGFGTDTRVSTHGGDDAMMPGTLISPAAAQELPDCDLALAHSLALYRAASAEGETASSFTSERPQRLSFVTEDGFGVPPSSRFQSADAFESEVLWLESEVRADDVFTPDALVDLGDMHYYGAPALGIPPNLPRAAQMYRRAEALGSGPGAAALASMIYSQETSAPAGENENATMFRLYRKAADAGEASGLTGVAHFYLYGGVPGVPIDVHEALALCKRAGEMGFMEGFYQAGLILLFGGASYDPGSTLARNATEAKKLFQTASDEGHVSASFYLATVLVDELPRAAAETQPACRRALVYFQRAIRSNWGKKLAYAPSKAHDDFYEARYADSLRKYMIAAHALWEPEAEMNAALLLSGLGGFHAPAEIERSIPFAMRRRHARAMRTEEDALSETLRTLGLVRVTAWSANSPLPKAAGAAALSWYEACAKQDVPEALRRLADCALAGWSDLCTDPAFLNVASVEAILPDSPRTKAVALLSRAAARGDGQAAWTLGQLHAYNGSSANFTRAASEFERAARLDGSGWLAADLSIYALEVRKALLWMLEIIRSLFEL